MGDTQLQQRPVPNVPTYRIIDNGGARSTAANNWRRLIQAPLVALVASRMRSGALVHLATDWEEYAHQMLVVLANEPLLANTVDGITVDGFAPRPDARPRTKFETRGLKLGHGVWDVVFQRR